MNEIVFGILPEMQDERIDKCISSYQENLSRNYIQNDQGRERVCKWRACQVKLQSPSG